MLCCGPQCSGLRCGIRACFRVDLGVLAGSCLHIGLRLRLRFAASLRFNLGRAFASFALNDVRLRFVGGLLRGSLPGCGRCTKFGHAPPLRAPPHQCCRQRQNGTERKPEDVG